MSLRLFMLKKILASVAVFALVGIPAKAMSSGNNFGQLFGNKKIAAAPVKYDSNLEAHIVYKDSSVPRSSGIGGAHNLDEFKKIIAIKGTADEISVVGKPLDHPTQKGFFYKYTYQIRALDKASKPTVAPAPLWKTENFVKTVYDPSKISTANFIKMGKEAADNANSNNALTREWTGTAKNGVVFRGYINSTGEVVTFFPDM
jgi:Bacterial EndoU nuclease